MPINDEYQFRPDGHRLRRERRGWGMPLLAAVLLLALAIGGWLWWTGYWTAREPRPAGPAVSAVLPPVEPAVRYPLEELPPTTDVGAALRELLGGEAVSRFLQTSDFPRRVVATVDNLGREQATTRLWPVNTTPGRFSAQRNGEVAVLSDANAARYRPFVQLVERISPQQAVDLYRSLYPQLQQAYANLGMGSRYFNDRLVEVIDLLLATPIPAQPPRLQQFAIKGPMGDPRPWVRWEFVDPSLQSLSAGQKMLLRMGPDNQRRLQAVLARWRAELVSGPRPAQASPQATR
ncbi:DUF3014 domain-containing protein [Ramlibacter rhizophilus]|uniref:DUF3014 domain-containing protein n=1 Tax=Ramlibacter rhizophilus TaxID=1781167 RepID=A0A4Z0C0R3_9BURK|nr:DUF3014 domain-containing protein [Ramlibacter rhizophilus]TFZ04801.1 DUF3014 domain-containing protein [Ramlibacter rhizophilus]